MTPRIIEKGLREAPENPMDGIGLSRLMWCHVLHVSSILSPIMDSLDNPKPDTGPVRIKLE
jgi:hypothetical protein